MDEGNDDYAPNFVYGSVLRLYKKELQTLIDDNDSQAMIDLLAELEKIGYVNISQLVLGKSPKSLVGTCLIR